MGGHFKRRPHRVLTLPGRPKRYAAEADVPYGLRLLAWLCRAQELDVLREEHVQRDQFSDDERAILRVILERLLHTSSRNAVLVVVWCWLGLGDVPPEVPE